MIRTAIRLGVVVALVGAAAGAAQAQWGSLKGRVVYAGPKPNPEKIVVNKDVEVCGKGMLVDESLLVSETGGVANVAIWLRPASGQDVAVHPDLAKEAPKKVASDNSKCRFEPHIATVWIGKQTLVLKNSDPVGHNVNCTALRNESFNYLLPPGGSLDVNFTQNETLPLQVQCNIHPWMRGWYVVKDNPYMTVTDKDGNFEIANLPAGKWIFQFWHEKAGYLITDQTPKLGRIEVEIKSGGAVDLGKLSAKPEAFDK